jgi:hypothetical protein
MLVDGIHTKQQMRDIAAPHNVIWGGFDNETGRHFFQREYYRTWKTIGLKGEVIQEAGVISESWKPNSEKIYAVTECYPEQLSNGDFEYLLANNLTQGDRPE